MNTLKVKIESYWDDRKTTESKEAKNDINTVIDMLDKGMVRIAEKVDGKWVVNEWLKKAVLMYFPINKMELLEYGIFE